MKANIEHINCYRLRKGPMASTDAVGRYGFFLIPKPNSPLVFYICLSAGDENSGGDGWEHASIRMEHSTDPKKGRAPTWEEMCYVKDLLWDAEECVVQFHPPKSDYVNNHPNVLHLWKHATLEFPRPSSILVGIK